MIRRMRSEGRTESGRSRLRLRRELLDLSVILPRVMHNGSLTITCRRWRRCGCGFVPVSMRAATRCYLIGRMAKMGTMPLQRVAIRYCEHGHRRSEETMRGCRIHGTCTPGCRLCRESLLGSSSRLHRWWCERFRRRRSRQRRRRRRRLRRRRRRLRRRLRLRRHWHGLARHLHRHPRHLGR